MCAYGIPYVKRGNEIYPGCRTTLNDAFMMTDADGETDAAPEGGKELTTQ